jgi:hypothetical protein
VLRRALLASIVLWMSAACGDDPAVPATPAPADEVCAEGETATADGCEIARPAGACPAGTREALGSEACTPVGVAACGPGFEAHPSGWGCLPVIAEVACTGATREILGQAGCAPIGDCDAAFPPAGATHTVDAALPDAAVDATHFNSLAAALAAAPPGSTIAVERGLYAESVDVTQDVAIVGRCAASVVIEGAEGEPVVKVTGGEVSLRGLTLAGGTRGLRAEGLARVKLADALLEDNRTSGIDAFDGAEIDGERVVVRGTFEAARGQLVNGVLADAARVRLVETVVAGAADAAIGTTGGGRVRLERTIVRGPVPRTDGVGGLGVRAFEGARVEMMESAVIGARGVAILAGSPKTAIVVERSTIAGTRLDDRPGLETGTAISIQSGASLTFKGATVADSPGAGIAVRKGMASAAIERSVVVNITGDAIVGSGVGVFASESSRVSVIDSAIVLSTFSGVTVDLKDAELTMRRSLVADTRAARGGGKVPADSGGYSLLVNRGGAATVHESTLVDARDLGAVAGAEGSILRLERTLVARTSADSEGRFGHGLLSLLGGRVFTDGVVVAENAGAGLLFDRGGGIIRKTAVLGNEIGIHVQEGAELIEGDPDDEATHPLDVWVSTDTRFVGNASRVGSGQLAVPKLL